MLKILRFEETYLWKEVSSSKNSVVEKGQLVKEISPYNSLLRLLQFD